MIQSIRAEDFAGVYPEVQRFFASFLTRSKGLIEPGDLERQIIAGHRQCYVATRDGKVVGCVLSTVSPGKVISVDYVAGDDLRGWPDEMREMFLAWKESMGGRIVVTGRPGWIRVFGLHKCGFRKTHEVVELD